jgi:hypothetical protein
MQCTNNAGEFCGAGNLNSVYTTTPSASNGCTAVCPPKIANVYDPNLPLRTSVPNPSSGQLFCQYVDQSKGQESECYYDLVSTSERASGPLLTWVLVDDGRPAVWDGCRHLPQPNDLQPELNIALLTTNEQESLPLA